VVHAAGPGGAGRRAEFCEPPFEQAPLGVVVDERQRAAVGITGLFRSTEAAQKLGPR